MKTYPKIETLFTRDDKFKITDQLRRPVFADISKWIVTEKVDGTNIRVSMQYGTGQIRIGGRTEAAQIHADLVRYLYEVLPHTKMETLFNEDTAPETGITLFGEGYGAGIQKGGSYRSDKAFILFDVLVEQGGDAWWQDENTVTDFAKRLGIDRVPILGEWSLGEIIEKVRVGVPSVVAEHQGPMAEGVVGKTRQPLFDRRGNQLILKLKTKDF